MCLGGRWRVAGLCRRILLGWSRDSRPFRASRLGGWPTRVRGQAISVELARAGAYGYATGHSSRAAGRSEMNRAETIEKTGELMAATGRAGLALLVDHLEPGEVSALAGRIDSEQGRLDILINDIFGCDAYVQGDRPPRSADRLAGARGCANGLAQRGEGFHAWLDDNP